MMRPPRILLFDSGMGGLTVAREVRAQLPQAHLLYAADNAGFPYGAWKEKPLIERIVSVMGKLIELVAPDIIIIACNTASTLALSELRKAYPIVFIGTVPAIKPAAAQTKSAMISVLATPATISREYTRALIDTYAYHCDVFLHGAKKLAELAELKLKGYDIDLEILHHEIAPVFRKQADKRTDVVVLGCTHYPLLLEDIKSIAPWPVIFIDPAPAIARRASGLVQVMQLANIACLPLPKAGTAIFTKTYDDLNAYVFMGFPHHEFLEIPV